MNTQDFLLELGCEELPPKRLQQLSNALTHNLTTELDKLKLSYSSVESFATPRRLAVLVSNLQLQQNDQTIERKGPPISAPNQAIEGFAKSCGVAKNVLAKKVFGKTEYYFFTKQQKGFKTIDLLESAIDASIQNIPIAKPMRWSDLDTYFVRPTHWLIMMLGSDVVPASIMGLTSNNTTRGLRFTGERTFGIAYAKDYQKTLLEKAQIEVNFNARKEIIRKQVMQVAKNNNAIVVIDESLLDEVCALVEYPRAFSGSFSNKFLDVPKEALISAMKSHQKYFHMLDTDGNLMSAFISVANIESSDLSVIVDGNERVIRPRLADSEFFWEQDKSTTLESRIPKLDRVLFMDGLGSMGEKARRIETLSGYIADIIGANTKHSARAGLLSKTDLITDMVSEFADLQGVMGGYYALNDGEDPVVASAISEHYHPRFSGDTLPSTKEGLCVAIADKVDSIVGIYGIGHKPTGSKDPYTLKRAALGLLRMMIGSKSQLDLFELIEQSVKLYEFDEEIIQEIYDFTVSRLEMYYQEQDIDKTVVKAVLAVKSSESIVYDWHLRIKAVHNFVQDENSKSLIGAYKRINNIFKNISSKDTADGRYMLEPSITIDGEDIEFTNKFDKNLLNAHTEFCEKIEGNKRNYLFIVGALLELKPAIDDFFDNVMVLDDDLELREKRVGLLMAVNYSFRSIANFSYLSK
ncbi:glycyl-tRNA synthetase beta subunit [Abyssogena phaseoliformis symbiont OG214]|uniref:glycine--tRNA ligase subunit beta n=1 Tax=Abyssogena phaseoliformis symbiont TaxID=596095 RepID=UPI00191579A7|nr:glycine--tRNA ligase subunit beta [Abyssogena phaseoliformis symbiont]MBW5288995.1 Glycyl-tRNA synthetase beta chain [Candidatus Ruthia sp. Apha_13_S6]BBB22852.1 glycyl-tRNA synthetase beta subunit [Abyssogena phaseoliformis symbiont OG214]